MPSRQPTDVRRRKCMTCIQYVVSLSVGAGRQHKGEKQEKMEAGRLAVKRLESHNKCFIIRKDAEKGWYKRVALQTIGGAESE